MLDIEWLTLPFSNVQISTPMPTPAPYELVFMRRDTPSIAYTNASGRKPLQPHPLALEPKDLVDLMALDNDTIKQLIKQLETDRAAYLSSQTKLQEALVQVLAQNSTQSGTKLLSSPPLVTSPGQLSVNELDPLSIPARRSPSFNSRRTVPSTIFGLESRVNKVNSVYTGGDSEDSDEDESFFVQEPLPTVEFSEDDLRDHLKNYDFNDHGKFILRDLRRTHSKIHKTGVSLFENEVAGDTEDANYSHADIYEVGDDGAPLRGGRGDILEDEVQSIWHALRYTNTDKTKRQAVGKIAVLREPSPLLLGALHLSLNDHFDMDSIYRLLIDDEVTTKAYIKGYLKEDHRRQRSIVFCFKYHTLVGKDRHPLPWQNHDEELESTIENVPISTCSSIVALSLSGPPVRTLRRQSRKSKSPVLGQIYDPFAPWHVLSLQCFPDWHSEVDVHETNHHYVNGPDAFMVTLLNEYRDAVKRFKQLNQRIVRLATPLKEVVFNARLRDKLLFESDEYTYSRRYFWAAQTLGLLADEIEAMINAYKETFTDDVWTGEHKTLFPGTADQSARYSNFRKKMAHMRRLMDKEIENLRDVLRTCIREQKDIKGLREWLFSGTSVLESREAVKQASITVEQGYNIKLLTLVTIFFLPLTFVTSIFGIENLPQDLPYWPIGVCTVVVCLPTYLLIGAINSLELWQSAWARITWFFVLITSCFRGGTDRGRHYKEKMRQRAEAAKNRRSVLSRTSMEHKRSQDNTRGKMERIYTTVSRESIPGKPESSTAFGEARLVPPEGPVYTHTGRRPSALMRESTIRFDVPTYRPWAAIQEEEQAGLSPSASNGNFMEKSATDPLPTTNSSAAAVRSERPSPRALVGQQDKKSDGDPTPVRKLLKRMSNRWGSEDGKLPV